MNWKRHSLIFRMGFCLVFVLLNSLTNAQTRKSALVLLPENEILKSLKQYDNFILQNNTDSIHQLGLYTQTAILPYGDTIRVKGKIDLWWSKNNHGIWALQKVMTLPTL
jgi:hypothetical protein